MNLRKSLFSLACISALFFTGCINTQQINDGLGAVTSLYKGVSISNEQLIAESKVSAKAMDKESKIAPSNSKYTKRLNKLTKGLKKYDGMTLNYKVYLSDEVNAFAMPDGTVRVYSGLMDIMKDDEVLAVIGHEIGHVAHKHSLNQYRKAYLLLATQQGVSAYGGTAGALAGSSYGDIAQSFLNAQFSQSDELESDQYGVTVLHKIGRDPYAAVSAQERLQEIGGAADSVFSSHPPSQKRIDLARAAADKITKK